MVDAETLVSLGTSTLYEASGLRTALDPAIRPVWAGAAMAGPAYPLACPPNDNLAIHYALERAPAGSILVVDAQGHLGGFWGEVLTVAAEARGVVGLVIDGAVRDVAALRQRVFPVFSRGVCMRGTVKGAAPVVGGPIVVGGVAVAPGDTIVADDDGVLALPAAAVEKTVAQARARADKEAAMMERLRNGETTVSILGLSRLPS